jgi:hypothetical protein
MWQRGNRGNISRLAQPGIAQYHKKMLCKLLCKCATPLPHRNFLFQYARDHAAKLHHGSMQLQIVNEQDVGLGLIRGWLASSVVPWPLKKQPGAFSSSENAPGFRFIGQGERLLRAPLAN